MTEATAHDANGARSNGSRGDHVAAGAPSMPDTNGGTTAPSNGAGSKLPSQLQWHRSFDRATVERFLAEVESERSRLVAAIAAARARAEQAKQASAHGQERAREELAELVLAAQREIEDIEAQESQAVEGIRAAAVQEAARLLADARWNAEEARRAAVSVAAHALDGRPIDAG